MQTPYTAGKDDRLIRLLLLGGVLVAPLFIGLSLVGALLTPGFSIMKHEVSLLLIGSLGWLQVTNFIASGLLGLGLAYGIRKTLRSGRAATWGPILVGIYGLFLVIAGLFHPDPQLGFPKGAPGGIPTSPSQAANIHNLAFTMLAVAIVAAGFVFARRFASLKERGWMIYSIANSIALAVFVGLGSALMASGHGGLPLLGAAASISSWVSAIALHSLRRNELGNGQT